MEPWTSSWIGFDYDPREDLGVFEFRNRLELAEVPASAPIRISADNRYKLAVNGEVVGFGPQRGDERHWFYDMLDLAPYLRPGSNEVVALVWNFGRWAPMAQHTVRTGFVVDGSGLETPGSWEVARLDGWDFAMMHSTLGEFYIDVGPGEILDARSAERQWKEPSRISQAEPRGASGGGTPWMLIPRSIPALRYEVRSSRPNMRHGFLGDSAGGADRVPLSSDSLELRPGVPVLLDYGELLCAYPRLRLKGAVGTEVKATYCEGLWLPEGGKGNRDEVAGKAANGYEDRFICSGDSDLFEPLWWRTYRYLKLEVDGPATLEQIDAIETGYPLRVESSFEADDPSVKPIWDVSVRTAERCAGETYFDCPYYEQLQYVGDTRIQALIGYYLGRDRALQRNAVETLGWSIMENGLTQSRYPSRQTQIIPPFSLWWVMMLYDQMLYDDAGRPDFVSPQTLSRVLGRYRKLSREQGQFWQFADWVPSWRWGEPPGGARSLEHQLTLALASHAALCLKSHWEGKAHDAVETKFWRDYSWLGFDPLTVGRGGERYGYSEHAEALHRLLISLQGSDLAWPSDALKAVDAAKCTFYFAYYKHLAMFGNSGEVWALPELADNLAPTDYMQELEPWKQMIENGLSTFAETPEPTRSDCHAWSAHPILGFFQIVAGVTSTAPGWKKARIMPHPCSLTRFNARIAHPDGELKVAYEDERLSIETPVETELVWRGKRETLAAGKHQI